MLLLLVMLWNPDPCENLRAYYEKRDWVRVHRILAFNHCHLGTQFKWDIFKNAVNEKEYDVVRYFGSTGYTVPLNSKLVKGVMQSRDAVMLTLLIEALSKKQGSFEYPYQAVIEYEESDLLEFLLMFEAEHRSLDFEQVRDDRADLLLMATQKLWPEGVQWLLAKGFDANLELEGKHIPIIELLRWDPLVKNPSRRGVARNKMLEKYEKVFDLLHKETRWEAHHEAFFEVLFQQRPKGWHLHSDNIYLWGENTARQLMEEGWAFPLEKFAQVPHNLMLPLLQTHEAIGTNVTPFLDEILYTALVKDLSGLRQHLFNQYESFDFSETYDWDKVLKGKNVPGLANQFASHGFEANLKILDRDVRSKLLDCEKLDEMELSHVRKGVNPFYPKDNVSALSMVCYQYSRKESGLLVESERLYKHLKESATSVPTRYYSDRYLDNLNRALRAVKFVDLPIAVNLYLELLKSPHIWIRFTVWSQLRYLSDNDFGYDYHTRYNRDAIYRYEEWARSMNTRLRSNSGDFLTRYIPNLHLFNHQRLDYLRIVRINELEVSGQPLPEGTVLLSINKVPVKQLRHVKIRNAWELIDAYLAGHKGSSVTLECLLPDQKTRTITLERNVLVSAEHTIWMK